MRRHLILVRHAKSDWNQPAAGDHERTLSQRGRKALPPMNQHLTVSSLRPDLVWCSSAQRTIETLAGLRSALPEQVDIEIDRDVYDAHESTIVSRLHELGDAIDCAMVVGHNPTMQHVALLLADAQTSDVDAYVQVQAKVPTGAIMTMSFDRTWGELEPSSARLDSLFTPRPPRD